MTKPATVIVHLMVEVETHGTPESAIHNLKDRIACRAVTICEVQRAWSNYQLHQEPANTFTELKL